MIHLLNNKEEKFKLLKKRIFISIIFSYIFYFSIILYLINNTSQINNINIHKINNTFNSLNLITISLSIMAYVSCLVYYISSKNNNHFLLSLIYLNICILSINYTFRPYNSITYANSFFRLFIFGLIIFNKPIKVNKVMLSILSLLSTIILVRIDIYLSLFYNSNEYPNIFISNFIIVSNLAVSIVLGFIAYTKYSPLYIFIMNSLISLSFRSIVFKNYICDLDGIYRRQSFLILCFLFIIFGVYFELYLLIKRKTDLEKELSIFYQITDLNLFENILLFNKYDNLSYVNKNFLDNYIPTSLRSTIYIEIEYYIKSHIVNNVSVIERRIIDPDKHKFNYISHNKKNNSYYNVNVQRVYTSDLNYYNLVSFNDITKEYLLNISRHKNEELLENINNNIQDIIIGITDDGLIKYANNAALHTFACKNNELIGKCYTNFITNSISDINLLDNINKYQIKNLSGDIIEIESIVKKLDNLKNSHITKIIIANDLTQKNKLDNLKLKYNEVKAFEKSKNEFFANLSHELKTPLNIIYSTLQLFEKIQIKNDNTFKSLYIKYKDALRINSLRMLRLINNLIDLTKADDNSIDVNFINLNIVELAESITDSVIPYANMKNLNIIFDTNKEDAFIKCDPEKIERILLNLLSNAIKFTPENKNIYVNINANKDWVDIYIKDEGVGIPDDMKNIIFERFVQLDKSLNRNTEGSGIGLSIVKSLVDLHNGSISLDSSKNNGTTFKVSLPNQSLSYNKSFTYNTQSDRVELELSDIYEVF